jgi:spoIIIJ-associated protein
MESVEVSAKSVDEAIDIALSDLGLKRNQVSIEILTPGKPGLFGLGGEPARIRVTALEEGTALPMAEAEEEEEEERAPRRRREAEGEAPPLEEGEPVDLKDLDSEEVQAATEFLRNLIEGMDIDAEVTVREPETAADGAGRASAVLDIEGEDLGLLIGRRGQTLASMQYLLNLIVAKQIGKRASFGVDVDGYRRRREESLVNLAKRTAARVRGTGRSVTLEPMPPNERRIVHITLADDPNVMTVSIGEGEGRKVAITPTR